MTPDQRIPDPLRAVLRTELDRHIRDNAHDFPWDGEICADIDTTDIIDIMDRVLEREDARIVTGEKS